MMGEKPPSVDPPMFRFTTSNVRPYYRVLCLRCGWKVKGSKDPRATFSKADSHVCV